MSEVTNQTQSWFDFITTLSVWFTIIGLPLTLIGLRLTWLAKSAALSAERSARNAVNAIRKIDRSLDINTVVEKMRDLKDAIRKNEFDKVTIISSDMRRSIVKLKTESDLKDKIDSDRLGDLITFFGSIESNFGIENSVGIFDLESFNLQENYLVEVREIVKRAVEHEKI